MGEQAVTAGESGHYKRHRKISLYNGDEKLSDIGVPSSESNGQALRRAMIEMERSPILTHAVFRDRNGKLWVLPRSASIFKRLHISILAH